MIGLSTLAAMMFVGAPAPASFTAADEPLRQIVARMAEGSGQPLAVVQKLAEERLVIYAPDADWDDLKEQIAWTFFAEWIPQPDGTLRLDRTPAGTRQYDAFQREMGMAIGREQLFGLITNASRPLTADEADRLTVQIVEGLKLLSSGNALDDYSEDFSLGITKIEEVERVLPDHRLIFKILSTLPELPSQATSFMFDRGVPVAVVSSYPEFPTTVQPTQWQQWQRELTDDHLLWAKTVEFRQLEARASEVNGGSRSLPAALRPIPQAAVNIPHDFVATVRHTPYMLVVRLYLFNELGDLIREIEVELIDEDGSSGVPGFFRESERARFTSIEPLGLDNGPTPFGKLLADSGGWKYFGEFQLSLAKGIAEITDSVVIFPSFSPTLALYFEDEPLELLEVERVWATLQHMSARRGLDPAVVRESGVFKVRRIEPQNDWLGQHSPKLDRDGIQQLFALVAQTGRVTFDSLSALARLPGLEGLFLVMQGNLWEAVGAASMQSRILMNLVRFEEAQILGHFNWSDLQSLRLGEVRRLSQLAPTEQRAIHKFVYRDDFFPKEKASASTKSVRDMPFARFGSRLPADLLVSVAIEEYPYVATLVDFPFSEKVVWPLFPEILADDIFSNRVNRTPLRYPLLAIGNLTEVTLKLSYKDVEIVRTMQLRELPAGPFIANPTLPLALQREVDEHLERLRREAGERPR